MSDKQVIQFIQNSAVFQADDKIWEQIREKLKQAEPVQSRKKTRSSLHWRVSFACACAAVVVAAGGLIIFFARSGNPATVVRSAADAIVGAVTGNSPAVNGGAANSVCMFLYYKYEDRYYKLEYPSNANTSATRDFKALQGKIGKHLGGDFYEIKGYDTSKCIAYFNGRYYYKADYAFDGSVNLNGENYVIAANSPYLNETTKNVNDSLGNALGMAGAFAAYAVPGIDSNREIALKIDSANLICVAYQMPSAVSFQGVTYYTDPMQYSRFTSQGINYLGMAGSYVAYAVSGTDLKQSIIIKLGDKQVTAKAFAGDGKAAPQTWLGSPFDSMHAINGNIIWNNAVFQLSTSFDYQTEQSSLKQKLGRQLGSCTIGGVTDRLYAINGVDTTKTIALKNNEVYLKYDFLLSTAIQYNGRAYHIIFDDGSVVRGDQIGASGNNPVYAVKGVDPSDKIVVLIGGTTLTAVKD